MTRRRFLTITVAALLAPVIAAVHAREVTTASAESATNKKVECPADYQKGSPACKRAKAERKCPEQLGGKCLGKR
ncbi:MAG: hypothetical protein N2Z21_06985 [Candidatus Sumerlaeaceae bacterium]|nr:hypothetical protein [Candidatus Sumerlaeaceae bacterium]